MCILLIYAQKVLFFCAYPYNIHRYFIIFVHMPFDPKIPNNDLPLLPFNTDFRDPDILIQLGETNVALAQLNERAKQIPNERILLDFISTRE